MGSFTVVDGAVAAVVLVSALLAYARGFIRETMAIFGWVAAAFVAYFLAPAAEPLVREIPALGDYLRDSCELSTLFAFAAVFAISLAVLSVFTPLLSSAVRRSALNGIDQGAGFLFGAVRGFLLIAVLLVVYDLVGLDDALPAVEDSITTGIFDEVRHLLSSRVTDQAPGWIYGHYEQLLGACVAR